MSALPRAIFVGVLGGILLLLLFDGLADQPALASDREPISTPVATAQTEPIAQSNPQPDTTAGCSLGAAFPQSVRRWCDLIERYAAQNGLDPNLIAAVMLQESGGKADALSHSGAVGLLQVMPRDGKAASFQCVNGPCFRSRPSMSELYDPEYNIRYGVGMLAGLVQRHGSVREALRSYGPGDAGYSYADRVLAIYAARSP
jgi:soluble lytic murein transglycosylase-like protein